MKTIWTSTTSRALAIAGCCLIRNLDAQTPAETNKLVLEAYHAVQSHHLVKGVKPSCVQYLVDAPSPAGVYLVDLREDHRAGCGGDPHTGPLIFTLRIDHRTGHIYADDRSPDHYRLIQ